MNTYECIMSRHSTRSYKEDMPSDDLIDRIVDAGRFAPSGMNRQNWHFTVVKGRDKIKEISSYVLGNGADIAYNAPVFIMVSYKENTSYAIEDTSCALTNMMQAASSLGLSSVWINAINKSDKASFMQRFSVPEGFRVYGSLALGYEKERGKMRDVKPREETVSVY